MNTGRLWETFCSLTSIDSITLKERKLCDFLKNKLTDLGITFYEDDIGKKIGGNCGNLFGYLPGELSQKPILFSSHMDTVAPGCNKHAVLHEDGKISSAGDTILGADDVAGITVLLEALERLRENKIAHRPIELLFTVAEESYGLGSALADYSRLQSKEAYVLDLSGDIGNAAYAAPTILSFELSVKGKAAHAGFSANEGIHAIAAVSRAIARLPLGETKPGVTCNIGLISGGEANNIVPENCRINGEIRSLSHDDVLLQWEDVKAVFMEEAENVGAYVSAKERCEIIAYETPLMSPVIQRFRRACSAIGVSAELNPTLGGSDNNNFAIHGITGIVLACSMHNVHSTGEFSYVKELEQCVQIIMHMITENEFV